MLWFYDVQLYYFIDSFSIIIKNHNKEIKQFGYL